MKAVGHLLIALVLFAIFYPIFGYIVLLPLIVSILVDFDHLFLVVKEKKHSFYQLRSLMKDIYKTKKKKDLWKGMFFLFHTVEFNVLLIILGIFYNPILIWISIGLIIHIISDLIHHSAKGFPILRWIFLTSFFLEK